jgi:hypothetical protein
MQRGLVLDYGWATPLASRVQGETTMTTNTVDTQPPMPGSELFIHNVDSAPAYW